MHAPRQAVLGSVACALSFTATGVGAAYADGPPAPAAPPTPTVGGSGSVVASGATVGDPGAGAPADETGVGISTVGTGGTPTASATAVPVQQGGTPVAQAGDSTAAGEAAAPTASSGPATGTASAAPTTGMVAGAPVETGAAATSTATVAGTTASGVTIGDASLVVTAHRTRRHTRTESTATIEGATRAAGAKGPPPPGVSAYGGRIEIGSVRASSRSEGGPKRRPTSHLSLHIKNLRVQRAGGGRKTTFEVTDATLRHHRCNGRAVANGTICTTIRIHLRDGHVAHKTLPLRPGVDLMDPRTYRGTALAAAILHLVHEFKPLTKNGGPLDGLELRLGVQQRSESNGRSSARLTAVLIAVDAATGESAREAGVFGVVRTAVGSVASAAKGAKAIAKKATEAGRRASQAVTRTLLGTPPPPVVLPHIAIRVPRDGLKLTHGAVRLTLTCSQPVSGTLVLAAPTLSSEIAQTTLDCRPGAPTSVRIRLPKSLREALSGHTDVPLKLTLDGAEIAGDLVLQQG